MSYFIKISLLFLLCSCSASILYAQDQEQARIFGSVSSSTGEVLIGVAVVLQNTPYGTTTNAEGKFELKSLEPDSYVLQVSYLGYETQEKNIQLKPSQQLNLNIELPEKAFMMETVEVNAKSLTRQINEQPFSVTAISAKDLYNSTSSATEVLDRVAGVRVMEEGGMGSDIDFTLNGFSGDQVKFFLDGIPMDNFGSSLGISSIPVNTIERIEVYKGVVPVWLGTDALGGAVNIVTNKQANFLDASYSFGSFNTHRLSVNGAHTSRESGFTVRGFLNHNYSDNNYKVWVPITVEGNVERMAEVERFHDRYRSTALKLETGWINKRFADNLLFGVLASRDDKQVQTGITMESVYGGIVENSQSVVPMLKYSKDDLFTEGLDVSLYSAYNRTISENIDTLRGVQFNWLGDTTFTPGSNNGELLRTYTTMYDDDFNSQFNITYPLNPHHSFSFNYSLSYFNREVFDAENPDKVANQFPKSLNKQILGLAYLFEPNKKWSATFFSKFFFLKAETSKEFDFALETQRTEAIEVRKDNIGYGFATTYFLLPELQLKASYENAYRLPWPHEIFGDGLFILPNPDLGPEQSNNFNAGVAYRWRLNNDNRINLESSFMYRQAEDLIYRPGTQASPQAPFKNLSQIRAVGIEGGIAYEWKNILQIGANITFQDITDQADSVYSGSYTSTGWKENFQKGFRLPNQPYLFANASAGLFFTDVVLEESALNLHYNFNFVEQFFYTWAEYGSKDKKDVIPRQSSHSLELSYSLEQGKYNVSVECQNLTDELLYDKYYLQKPGRAFYLKLRYVL